ncbi:oligosaccharide repeat unit polymerase [Vibrio cholerae]|nr:oligosaccharide repeat unit polymerase [Vibrio cholerae]
MGTRLYTNFINPFIVVAFISITALFYLLRLTYQFNIPNENTVVYLITSIFSLTVGVAIGVRKINTGKLTLYNIEDTPTKIINRKKIEIFAMISCMLSTVAYIYEHVIFYYKFGSLPILNAEFELLRLDFPVSGYIHILALSGFVFLFHLYFESLSYSCMNNSRSKSIYHFVLIFSLIHILLSLAVGNRGVVAYYLLQCFLLRSVFHRVSFLRALLYSGLFLYILGLAKFYRDYLFLGDMLYNDVGKVWFFGDNVFLIPVYYIYVTLCMNFEILNQYVMADFEPMMGYFTFVLPIDSLFTGNAYELMDFQRDVLGIDFHGVLTATGFGVPYFDFGLGGVIITFILSFVFGLSYYYSIIRFKLHLLPFYIYLFTTVITFVYTYNFNKIYVVVYLFLLIFMGCFSQRKYLR